MSCRLTGQGGFRTGGGYAPCSRLSLGMLLGWDLAWSHGTHDPCAPQVETLASLKALGRYVDSSQLTQELDGTFPYCHGEWVQFFQVSVITPFAIASPPHGAPPSPPRLPCLMDIPRKVTGKPRRGEGKGELYCSCL